ncbi:MAG: hypothetical protein KDK39_17595 [Leptospiraceae bacterium]|nr:hypothetical protein [Leptospiraceae bacterium]
MEKNPSNSLKPGPDPFSPLLQQILSGQTRFKPGLDLYAYQTVLDDWNAACEILAENSHSTRFVYRQQHIHPDRQWFCAPNVAFRSESVGIIYSDIVPLAQDCVLIELSQDERRRSLLLEPGAKNRNKIEISLYKEADLVEKLFLQKRTSWDLDQLIPGAYRLLLGKQKSFQFVIQE